MLFRSIIAVQIYAAANAAAGPLFEAMPSDDVLDRLATLTPRMISRVIMLALPRAVAAGRHHVICGDIAAAEGLLAGVHFDKPKRIGFTARQD